MTFSAIAVPSFSIRSASHRGTRPPWSGRSANPERFIYYSDFSPLDCYGGNWVWRATPCMHKPERQNVSVISYRRLNGSPVLRSRPAHQARAEPRDPQIGGVLRPPQTDR